MALGLSADLPGCAPSRALRFQAKGWDAVDGLTSMAAGHGGSPETPLLSAVCAPAAELNPAAAPARAAGRADVTDDVVVEHVTAGVHDQTLFRLIVDEHERSAALHQQAADPLGEHLRLARATDAPDDEDALPGGAAA